MRAFTILILTYINLQLAYAQWTEKDSIWLQNVLAGKDTIKLNPEYQRAIQSGTFLNPESPVGEQRMAPASSLPITKDFSEYVHTEDTTHRKVALKDLPPQVFWWYDPPVRQLPSVYRSIRDGIRRYRGAGSNALATFSIGDLTSRKRYIHQRNAKRNKTLQEYNSPSTPDVIAKRKLFERQHTEALRRDSIAQAAGQE